MSLSPTRTVHSVSDVTGLLRRLIEEHPPFRNVWVRGQVSNCIKPGSGHIYFTLKDATNQISCVIWRSSVTRPQFLPHNGEEVLARGDMRLYGPHGKYQLTVSKVEPLGVGALQRAFEELKQRLTEEGLFDTVHKKMLPKFPRKIGVVTSEIGAAFQDILQQSHKRYPLAEILLYPSRVQGNGAADEIVHAIKAMNQRKDIDILVVGRGGGSTEDLWAFNEEIVARAIFASTIPVVSAVGHETDLTISDFVADHRAPTPSAAIEHILPDQVELSEELNSTCSRLYRTMGERLQAHKTRLLELETRLSPTRRKDAINQLCQRVDDLETACRTSVTRRLGDAERDLDTLEQRLKALSPVATLKRGYSISRKMDGEVLTSVEQTAVGERIEVQLAQGHLTCRVEAFRDTERD